MQTHKKLQHNGKTEFKETVAFSMNRNIISVNIGIKNVAHKQQLSKLHLLKAKTNNIHYSYTNTKETRIFLGACFKCECVQFWLYAVC